MGGQELQCNLSWFFFFKKNIFILGTTGYDTVPPHVGYPCPFQSTVRVHVVKGDAAYNQPNQNQAAGGQELQYNQPWQFESENTLIWGAATCGPFALIPINIICS